MISLFTERSIPSSNKIIGSNRWRKDLWKVSRTRFLYVENFFSILLTASNIGKYPKSCLASGLLRHHVGILPIDKYIGCSWLLSNVSVVVASEYKISDNNLTPKGKEFSVFFHHIPVFCSL